MRKTEFKSVADLARNMIYAFILVREEYTVRLREAIENYRLRRSRFPVPAKLRLSLNKAQVLRFRELYGVDIKETVLFRSLIRLLIQHGNGEACSEYVGSLYRMFITGEMTDTVFKEDVEKKVVLNLKKRDERNDITRLMFDHNIRCGGYLMRRIAYMLFNPCETGNMRHARLGEDTYEEYLFESMARRDYGFQNYRR